MTTTAPDVNNIPSAPKSTGQAVGRDGIPTPEPSLGPDSHRIRADAERREAENARAGTGNIEAGHQAQNDNTGDASNVNKQQSLIHEVLQCGENDHRGVLKLGEPKSDPFDEEKIIADTMFNLGADVHPKYNRAENAEKAFERIIQAAKALGCSTVKIDELRNWDGDGYGDENDSSMEDIKSAIPYPDRGILEIYKEAFRAIHVLQSTPDSGAAINTLDKVNQQIRERNERDGLENKNQWVIKYEELQKCYWDAIPAFRHFTNNKQDQQACSTLDAVARKLADIIGDNHYPVEWGGGIVRLNPGGRVEATRPDQNDAEYIYIPPQVSDEDRTGAAGQASNGDRAEAAGPLAPRDRKERTQAPRSRGRSLPGFYDQPLPTVRSGHVLHKGKERKICGIFECGQNMYGKTHQLLLEKYSRKGRYIYDLVAASSAGKTAAVDYKKNRDAWVWRKGTINDLKDKLLANMDIGGVGYTKAYRKVVLADFEGDGDKIRAYPISMLWKAFQKRGVEKKVGDYCRLAGEPTDRLREPGSDEDDGTVVSLGSRDSSETNEEDDEVERMLSKIQHIHTKQAARNVHQSYGEPTSRFRSTRQRR
ncbi:hypothetical protein K469DRAFT_692168 [Zopfia rhizophila CBS 207.26]|uniref:Uncharacterized protein n=1 Tax=Zopfia rhizophila CBS 207.26 TaxID=1314779 RepID=A0A6A6DTJ7_9PEZI|nr:hypothetical protein K469DRAFT_692168 [Zopfia rhizophila CBS 207.26]